MRYELRKITGTTSLSSLKDKYFATYYNVMKQNDYTLLCRSDSYDEIESEFDDYNKDRFACYTDENCTDIEYVLFAVFDCKRKEYVILSCLEFKDIQKLQ